MAEPVLGEPELKNVVEAVRTGWISSQGKFITEFEEAFASFCGARYGVAVTSGTAALHLALMVLGIGPGDEVIIPTLTHIAVANAVTLTGARFVLADSEWKTWNMDPASVKSALSSRTRAIIAVHLYGHPVDMNSILEVAEDRGIYVVEDAAEAHGAEYKGRKTGTLGHLACFSFYANKLITTGEGGMIVTNDARLADRARKLRDQAYEKERRFWHRELGFNYRMTNLQAAVGLGQLERIERFIETRRRNARLYSELLADVPGLTLPVEEPWAKSVYWMYSVVVGDEFGHSRETLAETLKGHGIDTRPFFYPVHLQPLYAEAVSGQRYPVAEYLAARGLNLPSGNELTQEEVRRVVSAIKSFQAGGDRDG